MWSFISQPAMWHHLVEIFGSVYFASQSNLKKNVPNKMTFYIPLMFLVLPNEIWISEITDTDGDYYHFFLLLNDNHHSSAWIRNCITQSVCNSNEPT